MELTGRIDQFLFLIEFIFTCHHVTPCYCSRRPTTLISALPESEFETKTKAPNQETKNLQTFSHFKTLFQFKIIYFYKRNAFVQDSTRNFHNSSTLLLLYRLAKEPKAKLINQTPGINHQTDPTCNYSYGKCDTGNKTKIKKPQDTGRNTTPPACSEAVV